MIWFILQISAEFQTIIKPAYQSHDNCKNLLCHSLEIISFLSGYFPAILHVF